MYGLTVNEMLDYFIHGLELIISCKVVNENPWTFKEACILPGQVLYPNMVGGSGTYGKLKWHEPTDYALMDLKSMGAWECHRQADTYSIYIPRNKPQTIYFMCSKKGHIARDCWHNLNCQTGLNETHNLPRQKNQPYSPIQQSHSPTPYCSAYTSTADAYDQ